jgi:hypothetical protein
MANYVFKCFCVELDAETLTQMLKIVSTPNEKAQEIMQDEQGEESGSESYGDEVSDSEDD